MAQPGQLRLLTKEGFRYLLKMFPVIFALAIIGNTVIGFVLRNANVPLKWYFVAFGMIVGSVGGLAFGVLFRPGFTVASCITDTVSIGIGFGFLLSVLDATESEKTYLWLISILAGTAIGVLAAVGFIIKFGLGRTTKSRAAAGAWTGIMMALVVVIAGTVIAFVVREMGVVEINARNTKLIGAVVGIIQGIGFASGFGMTGGIALGIGFGLAGIVFAGAFALPIGISFGWDVAWNFSMMMGIALPSLFWLVYFRVITYLLDTLMAVITYLSGLSSQNAIGIWRWHPIRWNEVIWLPLPFLDKLLVLMVQQDRKEGFRQIAFVAAERRMQRRSVLSALEELAVSDLQAESTEDIADIADKLIWTTDAQGELLPMEMQMALPLFNTVASHIGQYITLHSTFRKKEALEHASEEMEALQKRLIASRGKSAPRLLHAANDWQRLIELEKNALKEQEEAERGIPNPFVFGNPIKERDDNVFSGRQDIVPQIEASMLGTSQLPLLILYGPRRMGKTSILYQLPRLLGPCFAPAIVDCQNSAVTGSLATLFRHIAGSLGSALKRRNINVKPLTKADLEEEPFAAFDEWLNGVERTIEEDFRCLLCLDEYERLQSILDKEWGLPLLDYLRHIIQHRPCLILMFVGVHTFEQMGPEWTDRFISARRIRVSFLTYEEVLPLLTKPIPEFGMTYAPGALDLIFSETNGQPFLTQAVAFELVQFLNEQGRKKATLDDVEEAVNRALERGGEYMANVWNDAGKDGQRILEALVKRQEPMDLPKARTWLQQYDVLTHDGKFLVPMMERWVREKIR